MPEDAEKSQKWKKPPRGQWKRAAKHPEPYDPLKLENLGRSIEAKMLSMDPQPITDVPPMYGAGIYAIYYTGGHEAYRPISQGCRIPIYVGKATPRGGRKGLETTSAEDQSPLWDRLHEHRVSLEHAQDLEAEDFSVRYLVAVDFFVSLAEQLMIRQFRPVWNTVVDGFGNHSPGGKRVNQARPPWDELHPGRPWSTPEKMSAPSNQPAEQSLARIRDHWEQQNTGKEEAPPPFPDTPPNHAGLLQGEGPGTAPSPP